MSDYNNYSFTINISELAETLKDARSCGCSTYVIINGMYYDIDFSEKQENKNNTY